MLEFEYINNLGVGVDVRSLEKLREDIKGCDYFISYGEGRSGQVAILTGWYSTALGKDVKLYGTPSFPNDEFLSNLRKTGKKLIFMPISGSGTTSSVLDLTKEMKKYSYQQEDYIKIVAVTSFGESELGKLSDYSIIIPGRTKENIKKEKDWYASQVDPEKSTMGDDFEEKSLLHLYAVIKNIQTGEGIDKIVNGAITEMEKDLKQEMKNGNYQKVEEYLKDSHRWGVFCHGHNQSGNVARMVANRMGHYDISAYVIGETNTPSMGYGQLAFLFSASGETEPVIKLVDKIKKVKANVVAVVGKRDCSLEKKVIKPGIEKREGAVLHVGDETTEGFIIPRKNRISSFYVKAPIVVNYLLRDFAGKYKGITEVFARQAHE